MNLFLNKLSKLKLKKACSLSFKTLSIFLCSATLMNAHAQEPISQPGSILQPDPVISPPIPDITRNHLMPVQITANLGYRDTNQNQYQTSTSSPQFFIEMPNPDIAISQGGADPYIDLYLAENTEGDHVRNKNKFYIEQPAGIYIIASNTVKSFDLIFENKTGRDDIFNFRAVFGPEMEDIVSPETGWDVIIKHDGEIIPETGLRVLNNEKTTLNVEVTAPNAQVWSYIYRNNLTYTQQGDNLLAQGMVFNVTQQNPDRNTLEYNDLLLIAFKPEERIEQIAIIPTRSDAETHTNLLNGTQTKQDVSFKIINAGNTVLKNSQFRLLKTHYDDREPAYFDNKFTIINALGKESTLPFSNGKFTYSQALFPSNSFHVNTKFVLKRMDILNPIETDYYNLRVGLTSTNISIISEDAYNYRIVWPKVQIEQAAFKVKTCENNYNDIQDLNPQDLLSSNDLLEEKSCLMMKYTVTNLTDHEFRPENIKLGIQIPNGLMPVSPMSTLYYDRSESSPSINLITGRYEINLSPASLSYYDSFIDRSRNIIEVYFKLKQDSDSTH